MPTYSLLEAKKLADELLDQNIEAEIKQVSAQRFAILPEPAIRQRSQKMWLIVLGVLATLTIAVLIAGLLVSRADFQSKTSASPEVGWVTSLANSELSTLIAGGSLTVEQNRFVEVKRIELGGYLTILANQTVENETKLVRIDLVKTESDWQIEKWVKLD